MKLPIAVLSIVFIVLTSDFAVAQFHSATDEVFENEKKLKNIRIPSLEFADTPLGDAFAVYSDKVRGT